MIRYPTSPTKLRQAIKKVAANWFVVADAAFNELPTQPKSSDFKPIWSKIKSVYIELQHSKCCFCEKPLEGKIEQDVEHFRPKAEVKSWRVPGRLTAAGVFVQQRADGTSEPGYPQMAYAPLNYAMACKTCNSTLKKNFFPIEGVRDFTGTDPAQLHAEKALLIYPIGSTDTDPQQLIAYEALSPVPIPRSGFARRRALVTIEIFRLDDSAGRKSLFKLRATLVRLLFVELELGANATSAAKRRKHQTAIDVLTSPESPFTNCLRSFERLYRTDPVRAEAIANECLKFMGTTSLHRNEVQPE